MIAPAFPTVRVFYRNTMARELIDKSPAHRQIFEVVLNRLATYFGGRDPYLDELTDDAVKGVMAKLLQEGRSRATCNQTRRYLLEIMRFAMQPGQRKLRKHTIDVKKYKEIRNDPRAWTCSQVTAILAAARQVAGNIPLLDRDGSALAPLAARLFWPALLLVIYDSGLRITATMRLVWEDVDFVARALGASGDAETAGRAIPRPLGRDIRGFGSDSRAQAGIGLSLALGPERRQLANLGQALPPHPACGWDADRPRRPVSPHPPYECQLYQGRRGQSHGSTGTFERGGHTGISGPVHRPIGQAERIAASSGLGSLSRRFAPAVRWPAGEPALVNVASTMDEDQYLPPLTGKQRLLF